MLIELKSQQNQLEATRGSQFLLYVESRAKKNEWNEKEKEKEPKKR